jgi:hypothetical protein
MVPVTLGRDIEAGLATPKALLEVVEDQPLAFGRPAVEGNQMVAYGIGTPPKVATGATKSVLGDSVGPFESRVDTAASSFGCGPQRSCPHRKECSATVRLAAAHIDQEHPLDRPGRRATGARVRRSVERLDRERADRTAEAGGMSPGVHGCLRGNPTMPRADGDDHLPSPAERGPHRK